MDDTNEDLHRRQDRRSLALHVEAVRVLRRHPERVERVVEVLDRWDAIGDPHSRPLRDPWRSIVETRAWDLALEDSERGQQLRQASPLGFVLEPAVRDAVLRRHRRKRD